MIREPMQYLHLDAEDEAVLLAAYEAVCANADCVERFDRARALFFEKGTDFASILEPVSSAVGVHRFTVALVFLLTCAERMRQLYEEHGYSVSLYRDALADVGVKAMECKKVYDVVGIFVLFWYPAMFTCRRFILGRLEYEEFPFPLEGYRDLLKKGDRVLNCHIPSSGSLPQEAVTESLRRAYDFYPEIRYDGILPVYCNSWLLYPPTAALYRSGSNLDGFFRNFEVLAQQEVSDEVNFWRVFYRPWSPDALKNAPGNTSLQRDLKNYLLNGGKMGSGEGLILFDGERIVHMNR